jgi:hypothetical protein
MVVENAIDLNIFCATTSTMIDFIQTEESVFLEYRPNIDENDPIVTKITALLDTYDCFKEVAFQHPPQQQHSSRHRGHNKTGHGFKGNSHHHKMSSRNEAVNKNSTENYPLNRKLITNNTQTSNDRITTSLLNKLSKRNYPKIIEQILRHLDQNNMKRFVDNVLEKCQKQSHFLDLYMNVLYDLYHKSFQDTRQIIHSTMFSYIDDFMKHREFIDEYKLDSKNYDQFCKNVSAKKEIIGKHKTVLAVIMKILKNNMIDDYFNIMFTEIQEMDETIKTSDDYSERHELLLDILTDFVRADLKYRGFVEKYYSNHANVLEGYSNKAKFKVMDIVCVQEKKFDRI